jgi:hypothetical protein
MLLSSTSRENADKYDGGWKTQQTARAPLKRDDAVDSQLNNYVQKGLNLKQSVCFERSIDQT